MSDHSVIWLQPKCAEEAGEDRYWCQDDQGPCEDCGAPSVKYVLATDRKALTTALAALKTAKGKSDDKA